MGRVPATLKPLNSSTPYGAPPTSKMWLYVVKDRAVGHVGIVGCIPPRTSLHLRIGSTQPTHGRADNREIRQCTSPSLTNIKFCLTKTMPSTKPRKLARNGSNVGTFQKFTRRMKTVSCGATPQKHTLGLQNPKKHNWTAR